MCSWTSLEVSSGSNCLVSAGAVIERRLVGEALTGQASLLGGPPEQAGVGGVFHEVGGRLESELLGDSGLVGGDSANGKLVWR